MFLFAILSRIFKNINTALTHIGIALQKSKSNAKDLAYQKRIHKNFARQNHEASVDVSIKFRSMVESKSKDGKKFAPDALMFDRDKKKKQAQDRVSKRKVGLDLKRKRARVKWEQGR